MNNTNVYCCPLSDPNWPSDGLIAATAKQMADERGCDAEELLIDDVVDRVVEDSEVDQLDRLYRLP